MSPVTAFKSVLRRKPWRRTMWAEDRACFFMKAKAQKIYALQ